MRKNLDEAGTEMARLDCSYVNDAVANAISDLEYTCDCEDEDEHEQCDPWDILFNRGVYNKISNLINESGTLEEFENSLGIALETLKIKKCSDWKKF